MSTQHAIKREYGFTLVEVMVALVIVVIVVAGIYGLYMSMHKTQVSQEVKAELQSQARNTLDFVSRELMMAGYHGGTVPIMENGEHNIKFREAAQLEGTQLAGETVQISYYMKDGCLMRLQAKNDGSEPVETIITGGVKGLSFGYYDRDNNPVTDPSEDKRKTIRRITMMVTMESSRVDPVTGIKRTTVFKADLVPRNLAEGEAPYDSIPPGKPANLHVVDNRDCTSLELKWDKNTEPDIAGYYIMYGTAAGKYSGVVTVSVNRAGFDRDNPRFKLSGLTPTLHTSRLDAGGVLRYYIAIKAYDNSMNYSIASDEKSGPDDDHLADDYTDFGSGEDTILNPKKPDPPSNVRAFNSSNNTTGLPWTKPTVSPDGRDQIRLTWTASPDAKVGYRIYRSDTPFSSFPIPQADASKTYIVADENGSTGVKLGPSTTTYLDTVDVSCKDYYYAICSVNCDNTLIYGNGDSDTKRYASPEYTRIGPVQAKDTSAPPDPDLTGSRGGYKRVFINLNNPLHSSCPDFDYTLLYVSDKEMPSFDLSGNVTGEDCQLVWDSSCDPYERGKFPAEGLSPGNSFVFNSMTVDLDNYAEPKLADNATYYFLAVAYNKCQIRSTGSTTAQTLATLCQDDPLAPGAPPAPKVTADGCGDTLTLTWDWPDKQFGLPFDKWVDLRGYYVYRKTSGAFSSTDSFDKYTGAPAGSEALLPAIMWGTEYIDPSVQDGATYYYGVRAADCRWVNITESEPDYTATKLNNISKCGAPDAPYAAVGPLYPGRIRRYQSDITTNPPSLTSGNDRYNFVTCLGEDPATGAPTYYHNAVRFYIQNTSAGEILLNQLNLTWSNAGAYLRTIKIGGEPATTAVDTYDISPPKSSSEMSSGKTLTTLLTDADAKATAEKVYSKPILVELVFTNSDGTVGQACDMRGDTLNVTLKYQNRSTGKSDCTTDMSITSGDPINVPGTPILINATQNQPSAGTNCFDIPGSVVPAHAVTDDHPLVAGGLDVFVSANLATDETFNFHDTTSGQTTTQNVLYASKVLDWAANDIGSTSPPSANSFAPVNDTNLVNNLARFTIPGQVDKRIWFYITAKSNTGNSARLPEVQNGYFMYDQRALTPCDHSPNPPANLRFFLGALTWDAPDHYVDGSALSTTTDPLKYDVWRQTGFMGGYTKIASDLTATTYMDPSPPTSATPPSSAFYKVVAKNSCTSPGPLSSTDSNVLAACATGAAACQAWTTTSSLTLDTKWAPVGSESCTTKMVDLTVYDCGLASNGKIDTLTVTATSVVGTSTMTFHEKGGDTGAFTYAGTGSASDKIYVTALSSLYGTSNYDNVIGATDINHLDDTITFAAEGCSGTAVVPVTTNPCANTPKAPAITDVTRSTSGHGSGTRYLATISLTAPSKNTDESAINDIQNYKVYIYNGSTLVSTTVTANATLPITVDVGANQSRTFKVSCIDKCGNEGALSGGFTQ